jgi:hypothetical protein
MPNYDESEQERKDRRASSKTRRNERKFDRALKDDYKSKLASVFTTAERRKIKAEYSAAKDRGGIYDVSTDTYRQYDNNQDDQNSDINRAGIDKIGSSNIPASGDGGGDLDGYVETEVTLCQNGSPVTGKILFKAD